MKTIGFSGTRYGMTDIQRIELVKILLNHYPFYSIRAGNCIGADEEFNKIIFTIFPKVQRISHPPINKSLCSQVPYTLYEEPKDYLERNKDIINYSTIFIACPDGLVEKLRSGTWQAIRYAKTTKHLIYKIIVFPDGSIKII